MHHANRSWTRGHNPCLFAHLDALLFNLIFLTRWSSLYDLLYARHFPQFDAFAGGCRCHIANPEKSVRSWRGMLLRRIHRPRTNQDWRTTAHIDTSLSLKVKSQETVLYFSKVMFIGLQWLHHKVVRTLFKLLHVYSTMKMFCNYWLWIINQLKIVLITFPLCKCSTFKSMP